MFDEIEKAHEEVINLFLQIAEDGVLTDSSGRSVSFKNTVIIMTSNVGGDGFRGYSIGFFDSDESSSLSEKLKGYFKTEFINRIDEVILFSPLSHSSLEKIAEKKLIELKARLEGENITLSYSDDVVKFLARRGKQNGFGARPLLRLIVSSIENPVSELLLAKNENTEQIILKADIKDGEIAVTVADGIENTAIE